MIQFRCTCGKTLAVRDSDAGKSVRCPNCGAVQQSPGGAQAAPVAEASPERPQRNAPPPPPSYSAPPAQARRPQSAPPSGGGQPPASASEPYKKFAAGGRITKQWCFICGQVVGDDDESQVCPGCQRVYHMKCWKEKGGCAVYGCEYHTDYNEGGAGAQKKSAGGGASKPKKKRSPVKFIILMIFLCAIGGVIAFVALNRDKAEAFGKSIYEKAKGVVTKLSTYEPGPEGEKKPTEELGGEPKEGGTTPAEPAAGDKPGEKKTDATGEKKSDQPPAPAPAPAPAPTPAPGTP